jgi:hypothetical protein
MQGITLTFATLDPAPDENHAFGSARNRNLTGIVADDGIDTVLHDVVSTHVRVTKDRSDQIYIPGFEYRANVQTNTLYV